MFEKLKPTVGCSANGRRRKNSIVCVGADVVSVTAAYAAITLITSLPTHTVELNL